MPEILIHIKDGKVKAEVNGAVGPSCTELTRLLQERLGGKVIDQETKPEYSETSIDAQNELGL